MMLRYAVQEFSSIEQIKEYIDRYPLPALPELDQLAEMEEYISAIPPGFVQDIQRDLHQDFRSELQDLWHEINVAVEEELVYVLSDIAVRDAVYLVPDAQQAIQKSEGLLRSGAQSLTLSTRVEGEYSDKLLDRAWDWFNGFFDAVETATNVAVPEQDRYEFVAGLLDEVEDTLQDLIPAMQEEMLEGIRSAAHSVDVQLQQSLDVIADKVMEDVVLEFDPVGHMTGYQVPFHDWETMVVWYEALIDAERALPSGPEFKTKSRRRGPRVVDVTHMQEENKYALQR